jgi:uncharacterized cupin superfamily protein
MIQPDEFGHVISGTPHAVVGFDKFVLGPGDSITFPSSAPHRFGNEGSETARSIWVVRGHEASFTGRHCDDQSTAVQHR